MLTVHPASGVYIHSLCAAIRTILQVNGRGGDRVDFFYFFLDLRRLSERL